MSPYNVCSRLKQTSNSLLGPHIFFLDEPTNHLDMKSVDALLNGLKSFPGGIVIITHDQR